MTLAPSRIGSPFKSAEFLRREIPCFVAVDGGIASNAWRGSYFKGFAESCDSKGAIKVQIGNGNLVTGLAAVRRLK